MRSWSTNHPVCEELEVREVSNRPVLRGLGHQALAGRAQVAQVQLTHHLRRDHLAKAALELRHQPLLLHRQTAQVMAGRNFLSRGQRIVRSPRVVPLALVRLECAVVEKNLQRSMERRRANCARCPAGCPACRLPAPRAFGHAALRRKAQTYERQGRVFPAHLAPPPPPAARWTPCVMNSRRLIVGLDPTMPRSESFAVAAP